MNRNTSDVDRGSWAQKRLRERPRSTQLDATERQAAISVCDRARDRSEAEQLLAMLGLRPQHPEGSPAPRRGRGPAADNACGTYRGYYRHRRREEQACRPCLDALGRHQEDQRKAPARRQVLLEALAGFDGYRTGRRADDRELADSYGLDPWKAGAA